MFYVKYYLWFSTFKFLMALSPDFHPITPGLEVKLAIEEAKKLNKKVIFGGEAFGAEDVAAFRHEPRMDILNLMNTFGFAFNNH